ncbi:MAG: putative bicarbonate transporter, IctB family, partial [Dolichospermum sp.]
MTLLLIFIFGDSTVENLWGIKIPPRMMLIWRNWSLPIFLGSVVGILAIGMIFVEPFRERVLSIFADRKDSSNNFRKNVWDSVFQ